MLKEGNGRMFTVAFAGLETQPVVFVPTTVKTVEVAALTMMLGPDKALDQA